MRRKKGAHAEARMMVRSNPAWEVGQLLQAAGVTMKVVRIEPQEGDLCTLVVVQMSRLRYKLLLALRWLRAFLRKSLSLLSP